MTRRSPRVPPSYAIATGLLCFFALGIAGAVASERAALSGGAVTDNTVIVTIAAPMSAAKPIPITAPAGSTFTINLASNQTTGYSWRLTKEPNKAVLKSLGSTYAAPTEGRLGMGGAETWTFRAAGTGKVTIVLEYLRPWEKGVKPIRSQAFTVTVM